MRAPDDLTMEQYVSDLRENIGTVYRNVWSREMFGPHMPGPFHAFNTGAHIDNIRKFVDATGDINPLYRDSGYASGTRFGTRLAPPAFLYSLGYGYYPNPQDYAPSLKYAALYAGDEYEWFDVLREGDEYDVVTTMPTRVEKRATRTLGDMVFFYGTHDFYRRSDNVLVARADFWGALKNGQLHEREAIAEPVAHTAERVRAVELAQDAEQPRGATPRYWEDVEVGEELTPVVRGPYTIMEAAAWLIGGVGERYFISDRLGRYMREHTGWGQWDEQLQKWKNFHEHSLTEGAHGMGSQRTAWIGVLLSNWAGNDGFITRVRALHRVSGRYGNIYHTEGRVTAKRVVDGLHLVDLEVWVRSHDGTRNVTGEATIALPTRGSAVQLPLTPTQKEL